MKSAQLLRRLVRIKALSAAAALSFGGIALAADPATPMPEPSPSSASMDAGKSVPPSTSETSDDAFKKLAAGKTFVSPDDTRALPGFDKVFDAADANHDGRLSAAEFKNAWKAYTAADKANRG